MADRKVIKKLPVCTWLVSNSFVEICFVPRTRRRRKMEKEEVEKKRRRRRRRQRQR